MDDRDIQSIPAQEFLSRTKKVSGTKIMVKKGSWHLYFLQRQELSRAEHYFPGSGVGVNVQVQPAFLVIRDFLSGEMRRLSESGSAILNATGDTTPNSSSRVSRLAGTGLRLPGGAGP